MDIKRITVKYFRCKGCQDTLSLHKNPRYYEGLREEFKKSLYPYCYIFGRNKYCYNCALAMFSRLFILDDYYIEDLISDLEKIYPKREKTLTDLQIKRRAFNKSGVKKRILEKYAYRCLECGDHHKLHVDHITPLSKEGDNQESNLRVLCQKCNLKKGVKIKNNV